MLKTLFKVGYNDQKIFTSRVCFFSDPSVEYSIRDRQKQLHPIIFSLWVTSKILWVQDLEKIEYL